MINRATWVGILFGLLVSMASVSATAQRGEPPWATGASRGEDLRIGLITFSRGDDIPSWFGHTALYVRDDRYKEERVYNYGMFSFGPTMLANFLSGRLEFWVGQASFPRMVSSYASLDRDVRLQILNLAPKKREEIAAFLDWNVQPENRKYLYDHYYDNCATRIRDVIDKAVDGQFAKANDKPARFSLRGHTRRHTQRNLYIDVVLTFWMNGTIDVPIRQWDEMFLPTELEMRVDELQYTNEAGELVPLVLEKKVLYKSDRGAPPAEPSILWPWLLLMGVVWGGAAVGLARWWMAKPESRGRRVVFGLYHVLMGLLIGLPGLILVLFNFTDHIVAQWNINILLASPLTFLSIPLGFAIGLGSTRSVRWMGWSWVIMAATSVLALAIMPFIAQDTSIGVALLLPTNIGFAWAFWPWLRSK